MPTQKFHQLLVVLVVYINLAAVEVFKELQDYFVPVALDRQFLGLLLAHQRSEHSPEFLALGS